MCRVFFDTQKIYENAARVLKKCCERDIELVGVTKGVGAHPDIVKIFWDAGVRAFGDSRLENLKTIRSLYSDAKLTLIRPFEKSRVAETVEIADCIFVSMTEALETLDLEGQNQDKKINVVAMIELGDLRDGILPGEARNFSDFILARKNLRLHGVAVNFGCFGAICPTKEKLEELIEIKDNFENWGHEKLVCSGGATSSLLLLERGELPEGVNQLRVGGGILLGTDVTFARKIDWLHQNTVTVEAEIIELSRKPSVPFGLTGRNAFGEIPIFEDRGTRLRAVAALGRQDVDVGDLTPLDEGVEILGASSDHLVLDLENCKKKFSWGDKLRFRADYSAMLRMFT